MSPIMKNFILASASPRRRELLAKAGFEFSVQTANVVEDEDPNGDPRAAVLHNALIKALAVAEANPDALVLGADTTVAFGGKVFNKPADMAEARAMLKTLGGNTHTVYTGVCLACARTGLREQRVFSSRVKFKPLDDATISLYFKIVNPLDKAGAYGIQAGRELVIDSYDEPLSNIMGLPVELISALVRELLSSRE